MRVGVLGTGRMGAFRARALAAHPEVEQVFVGSHQPERARELADAIGGHGGTHEQVLGEPLDALVISTITAEHPEHIAAGAQRGLPILCEKPISIDVADTETTIDLVGKAGVDLQIAFMRRFDAGFRRARELVSTGALGTVYSVRMCAHDHEPADERYIATSGGIFVDLHVHDFDMARWLTGGEVKSVFATGTVRAFDAYGRQDDVDTSAMVLTMDDGLPVVVTGPGTTRSATTSAPSSSAPAIRSRWALTTGPRSVRCSRTARPRPLIPTRGSSIASGRRSSTRRRPSSTSSAARAPTTVRPRRR